MNVVQSTANKVMELEKRMDLQLQDKSIRVSEVSRVVEETLLGESRYTVLTFAPGTEVSVVVQGEVEINTSAESEVDIMLVLDGFEVFNKHLSLSSGDHSVSVMKAINILSGEGETLELVIKSETEIYVKGFSFFVWGYGESLDLGITASEPKLFATEKDNRYAVCFSLDGHAFVCYCTGFPENLKFGDFSYFGNFDAVVPIYLDEASAVDATLSKLALFGISVDKKLYMFSEEIVGAILSDGTIVDEEVVSVTATKVKESDEIVVVYAKINGEIKYFSLVDGLRSEVMTLTKYDEAVSEVSLVQNCETTTFLVVGLENGRSYLYSSVTSVAWSDKLSHLSMSMEVSFP